jgi:hypothetical protein
MFSQQNNIPSIMTSSGIICRNPDFNNLIMSVDPQPVEAFNRARPGQGFVVIAVVNTGVIYFLPSYNRDDGLLKVDKYGQPWEKYLESIQRLGFNTGDLHSKAALQLNLSNQAGANGLLIGAGFWKSGISVKFLSASQPPAISALIPMEYYILTDDSKEEGYKIVYINRDRDAIEVPPEEYSDDLRRALRKLKEIYLEADRGKLQERKTIEKT